MIVVGIFLQLAIIQTANSQDFILGVDLSGVNQLEDCGVNYYDADGLDTDPYILLAGLGANLVRLRLWYNPEWSGYSDFADIMRSFQRAKEAGMEVMIDFHYSDFWADPSRQWRPEAWNGISDTGVLGDSLYSYTYRTLKRLASEGLVPGIVQLGNEINGNILIERTTEALDESSPGMYPVNWSRQIPLLKRAFEAVSSVNAEEAVNIQTLIHIAQPEHADWWFKEAVAAGLKDYDIIGISYYPQWSEFGVREVGRFIQSLKATYGKEVMIVETGMPWTTAYNDQAGNILGSGSLLDEYGDSFSMEMQQDFMTDLCYLVKAGGGAGVIYWEPAWVSSGCKTFWGSGSPYENATLFDFSNKLHKGAHYLSWNYNEMPPALEDQQVLFSVDMSEAYNVESAFITGDFTGESWRFEEMTRLGNDIYTLETAIPGRSSGAFIFYSKDSWDDNYRETVPAECAQLWGTHRRYVIRDTSNNYSYMWSGCEGIVSVDLKEDGPSISFNNSSGIITMPGELQIDKISICNGIGTVIYRSDGEDREINVSSFPAGTYFLSFQSGNQLNTFPFVKASE